MACDARQGQGKSGSGVDHGSASRDHSQEARAARLFVVLFLARSCFPHDRGVSPIPRESHRRGRACHAALLLVTALYLVTAHIGRIAFGLLPSRASHFSGLTGHSSGFVASSRTSTAEVTTSAMSWPPATFPAIHPVTTSAISAAARLGLMPSQHSHSHTTLPLSER
jgi:hypothetical protein